MIWPGAAMLDDLPHEPLAIAAVAENLTVHHNLLSYLDAPREQWSEVNHEYTRAQVAVNKCVEHWLAEYWGSERKRWQPVDANRTFLKAMSGIEVDYHLPRRHFEYAHESWRKMRTDDAGKPRPNRPDRPRWRPVP